MGLFKPAWMSKDGPKAMRALDKVGDDATLFQIATECPHAQVQIEAVRKMAGDAALFEAICDSRVPAEAKMAALGRAPEPVLADVVRSRFTAESDKLEAVARIGSSALLADIVKGENGFGETKQSVRVAAYERMERPPFECSMMVQSEKASENVMLDLDEMSMPEDRDRVMAVLTAKAFDRRLRQRAARLLPDDDPALDERCCPHCGTIGSVRSRSSWSEYWDDNIRWYECAVCDENDPGGILHKDEDFSVTLRELRDM